MSVFSPISYPAKGLASIAKVVIGYEMAFSIGLGTILGVGHGLYSYFHDNASAWESCASGYRASRDVIDDATDTLFNDMPRAGPILADYVWLVTLPGPLAVGAASFVMDGIFDLGTPYAKTFYQWSRQGTEAENQLLPSPARPETQFAFIPTKHYRMGLPQNSKA